MVRHTTFKVPQIGLQSEEHEEVLDAIDTLRSQGISRFVDLPQLIVCGDQSSGKSSVLEAISGLHFPTKDNLCTRFATELILRRGPKPYVKVTIIPGQDRSEKDAAKLYKFKAPSTAVDDFALIVQAAEKAMGLDSTSKVFSNDVLSVEMCDPHQPHLTLVDLPGIFYAGDRSQSDKDAILVQTLVKSYMEKSRTIILAVISAKSDLAMQAITKLAREFDPKGQRTMGIITKPDMLHSGSDSEAAFVQLARNENIYFKLGWHVLRNRDYNTRDTKRAERDAAEKEFFKKGIWSTALPKTQLGVENVRPRLSRVLLRQVTDELPNLTIDVKSELQACKDRLEALGGPRSTLTEQKMYLLKASQNFTTLMTAAVEGTYTDGFFAMSETKTGYAKRLRAVVQYVMSDFAETMAQKGHAMELSDSESGRITTTKSGPQVILRDEYLETVVVRMRRNRGRELPGLFNPSIIGDLFFEQASPWGGILRETRDKLLSVTKTAILRVLDASADTTTKDGIMRHMISPNIEPIIDKLNAKVEEVLRPHQRGHPVTFNSEFAENLQRKRQRELRKLAAVKLSTFFNVDPTSKVSWVEHRFSAKSLLDTLVPETERDMEKFAAIEATNAMEAYYEVALKAVIDAFGMYAIEACLLEELPAIFGPELIFGLDDTTVKMIAAESAESAAEREDLTKKLAVLEESMMTLRRLRSFTDPK